MKPPQKLAAIIAETTAPGPAEAPYHRRHSGSGLGAASVRYSGARSLSR
jgi:hypothetical protein